jgi:hypothetical protein
MEEVADAEELPRWEPVDRARVYYDLGQVRRFDPDTMGDVDRHFAAARAALEMANQLDPSRRYARALRDLDDHRRASLLLDQQQEAAERYREDAVPAAPPSYQLPLPATPTGQDPEP